MTDVPAMRVSPRFVERTRLRFDGALAQLTASQQLIFRCDVSQQAVGSPFEVIFDVAVDGSTDELGNLVSSWPEIRLLVATTGTANMLISVWLSSPRAESCRRGSTPPNR